MIGSMGRSRALRTVENSLRRMGYARVAGVDEAGRGCLAGPVVAAAVVLDPTKYIPGLRDSKLLSPKERDRLYEEILAAAEWTTVAVEADEIDRLNIHKASLLAMRDAVFLIHPLPDFVLVDAFSIPDLLVPQRGIVKGDKRCSVIAAASIIAKVTRDRQMEVLHGRYPEYGFDRHKGYGTAVHLDAIAKFGCSGVHRRSFGPCC